MDREFAAKVGRVIREARVIAGYTQDAVAEDAHISQGALSYYETGRRGITLETFVLIAGLLNTEPVTLLSQVLADAE
jgi:transcriptional regulator with XRE-family HTH domain